MHVKSLYFYFLVPEKLRIHILNSIKIPSSNLRNTHICVEYKQTKKKKNLLTVSTVFILMHISLFNMPFDMIPLQENPD